MNRIIVPFLLCLLVACNNKPSVETDTPSGMPVGKINYEIFIKNLDPEDHWQEECLSQIESEKLIEEIFESIYNHKAKAYDYFSDEVLSAKTLKKLEKSGDINRHDIAKIQFEENWYYDKSGQFNKEILSYTLAYPVFNNLDELRGYKPAFKVVIQ